jgi:YbbR domain-containing protein
MRNPFSFLFNNWGWKLLALGLALVVFTAVRRTISYRQTLTLTVEAESVEGNQALTGFEPGVVSVTFRGPEASIRNLAMAGSEVPRVRLKLRQPQNYSSTTQVKISPSDVIHARGLRVVSIEPNVVTASFDTSDTRTIDVSEPIVNGAPGNASVVVEIEPKTVEITGSRMLLDELQSAQTQLATAILDVTGRSESYHTTIKVLPPDNRGGWTLKPDTVRATVRFVREDIEQTIKKVPVRLFQSPKGIHYVAETETVEVTVQGARRDLLAIDPASVFVIIGDSDNIISNDAQRLECEPLVVFPCTNRVNRVEVNPSRIWLTPVTKDTLL